MVNRYYLPPGALSGTGMWSKLAVTTTGTEFDSAKWDEIAALERAMTAMRAALPYWVLPKFTKPEKHWFERKSSFSKRVLFYQQGEKDCEKMYASWEEDNASLLAAIERLRVLHQFLLESAIRVEMGK